MPYLSLFFTQAVANYNKRYSTLFGLETEEDGKEDATGTENEDERSEGNAEGFGNKWTWQYMVDNVAHLTNLNFYQVYDMNITEFLNYCCYLQDKHNWEKSERDKMINQK